MIRNSIIVTLLLILFYSLFLLYIKKAGVNTYPQNQQQDNASKIETLLFNDSVPPILVVGSSISARLFKDQKFKKNIYNFSLSGEGVLTPLTIVLTNCKPALIMIETNMINKTTNEDLIHKYSSKPIKAIKSMFPCFQDRYQPVSYIGLAVSKITSLLTKYLSKNSLPVANKIKNTISNRYSTLPDLTVSKENHELLNKLITLINKKKINFTFFEVPMDSTIMNSPKYTFERNLFSDIISKENMIKCDTLLRYYTTDGEHLQKSDALKYSDYLWDQIGKKAVRN